MSTSVPNSYQSEGPGFNSRDSEIIISDGPGDTTVRPARSQLLRLALAERQRLARLQEHNESGTLPATPPNDPKAKNSSGK
jgi:hypothetical protein